MMRFFGKTLLIGGLFLFLFLGSSALLTSAQTANPQCAAPQWWCMSKAKCVTNAVECDSGGTTATGNVGTGCPSGQIQCPAIGSSPAGCYTVCPTVANTETKCPQGQMTCWDPAAQKNYCYSGTTCPVATGTGVSTAPTAEEQMKADCYKTAGMQWCPMTANAKAYCDKTCYSTSVIVGARTRCEQQGVKEPGKWKWCKNQTKGTTSYESPEYDGWCTDMECPVNDADSCKDAGREWCENTNTAVNMTPAVSMSKGWCAQKNDPPCTQSRCNEKKGAKWCASQYGGTPWCSLNGECPGDEVVVFQWPSNKGQCEKYLGNWCQDSNSSYSSGGCMMGTEKCIPQTEKNKVWCWWEEKFANQWNDCQKPPQKQDECVAQGKNWCEPQIFNYTPATGTASVSSGMCSKNLCQIKGLSICPDGKTSAKKMEDCPTKVGSNDKCWDGSYSMDGKCYPEPKKCMSGYLKDTISGECTKVCPNNKKIKEGESCLDIGKKDVSELTDKDKEVLKKKESRVSDLQQFATFFRQVRSAKIASEIEKLLGKLSDEQRYTPGYWTDAKFEEIDKNIAALKVAKEAAEKRGGASDETEFKVDIEKAAIEDVRNSLGLTNNEQRLTELLDLTLPELEKEGIAVNEGVKNRLNDAAKLIEQIKSAETTDEVNRLGQSLTSTLKKINAIDRPYLKGLLSLQSVTDWYTSQIDDVETMLNGDVDAEIDGLKKDLSVAGYTPTASYGAIEKAITAARGAVANAKAGKASADPLGYLKQNVLQKLAQAQNEMDDIAVLLDTKDFLSSIIDKGGYLDTYQTQLNAMKKSRVGVLANKKIGARDKAAQAKALLVDVNKLQTDINALKKGVAQLKSFNQQKAKVNVMKLTGQLNDIIDRRENVRPEASVEDELKKLEGTFELPSFDLPSLKSAFLGTQGISLLFKKPSSALVRL